VGCPNTILLQIATFEQAIEFVHPTGSIFSTKYVGVSVAEKSCRCRVWQRRETAVRVAETLRANAFAEADIVTPAANLVCCVSRPR
jgi:hypothetical protein